MIEIVVSILILGGLLFTITAAVGVYRLPDIYCRAQASGMSSTFGAMFFMLAVVVHFTAKTGTFAFKPFLILLFIFFTGPIASHMLSRAAYFIGVKQHGGSVLDQMEDYVPPSDGGSEGKAEEQLT